MLGFPEPEEQGVNIILLALHFCLCFPEEYIEANINKERCGGAGAGIRYSGAVWHDIRPFGVLMVCADCLKWLKRV